MFDNLYFEDYLLLNCGKLNHNVGVDCSACALHLLASASMGSDAFPRGATSAKSNLGTVWILVHLPVSSNVHAWKQGEETRKSAIRKTDHLVDDAILGERRFSISTRAIDANRLWEIAENIGFHLEDIICEIFL